MSKTFDALTDEELLSLLATYGKLLPPPVLELIARFEDQKQQIIRLENDRNDVAIRWHQCKEDLEELRDAMVAQDQEF